MGDSEWVGDGFICMQYIYIYIFVILSAWFFGVVRVKGVCVCVCIFRLTHELITSSLVDVYLLTHPLLNTSIPASPYHHHPSIPIPHPYPCAPHIKPTPLSQSSNPRTEPKRGGTRLTDRSLCHMHACGWGQLRRAEVVRETERDGPRGKNVRDGRAGCGLCLVGCKTWVCGGMEMEMWMCAGM